MSLRDKFTDNLRWHILDTYIKIEIFWGKYNLKQIPKENAAQREAKSPFLNQQSLGFKLYEGYGTKCPQS